MKRSLIVLAITTLAVAACGSKDVRPTEQAATSAQVKNQAVPPVIPGWFLVEPSTDNDAIFVAGTGISRDMSMSVQKALLDAQNHIADRIAAEIDSLTKAYRQDIGPATGINENTEQLVRKLVSDIRVGGYSIANKAILLEGEGYRTFIQLRYPTTELYRQTLRSAGVPNELRGDAMGRELDGRKEQRRKKISPESGNAAAVSPVTPADSGLIIKKTLSGETADQAEED